MRYSLSMTSKEALDSSRKIVIKVGSNILASRDGTVNTDFMKSLAEDCAALIGKGKQIMLVSSGAQLAGLSAISGWAHKGSPHYRQALCAIGQVELMNRWRGVFSAHGLHVAQLLLTKDDFADDNRSLNIRNTMFTLEDENVIPVINENDSVSTDEFYIGDNDNLSALSAILWSADLLVLLSDIDGVCTTNPKEDGNAKLIETVDNIEELKKSINTDGKSAFGTGGIETKIEAAQKTTSQGIPLLLANGKTPHILSELCGGRGPATLFTADKNALFNAIFSKEFS